MHEALKPDVTIVLKKKTEMKDKKKMQLITHIKFGC